MASACATAPLPQNRPNAQYQLEQSLDGGDLAPRCSAISAPLATRGLQELPAEQLDASSDIIGPGDRLLLTIGGDKDFLTATYVVAANGRLAINAAIMLHASGRTLESLEPELRARLISGGFIREIAGNVRLAVAEEAGATVSVEGAVFDPGTVVAGDRANEARATIVDHPAQGDLNAGRKLSSALRAAGGVRPDAGLNAIYLLRGETYTVVDMSSALGGGSLTDPRLASGDRIIVPSTGCFHPELARPSPVTAPGVRVYMSNLARPAANNASAAINKDATSLPYGTRFLQALVAANCVGGSAMNAGRSAVLISRNPINKHAIVISRRVESLVRDAGREAVDPFLMPGDALACYDSRAMTVVDALAVAANILTPAALLKGLDR